MSAPPLTARLRQRLLRAGLDIVQPFTAQRVDFFSFETFGRERTLALLVANSRVIWPHVVARARRSSSDSDPHHPVDAHVVSAVRAALASEVAAHRVWWAHELSEPLPIQRIGMAAGLAHLAPCHLNIHPEHGPWIALRAVIALDAEGPVEAPTAADPCGPCDKACQIAFEAALAAVGSVEQHWRDWVAVRDACPIGRSSRYGEHQLRYHYAKDSSALKLDD